MEKAQAAAARLRWREAQLLIQAQQAEAVLQAVSTTSMAPMAMAEPMAQAVARLEAVEAAQGCRKDALEENMEEEARVAMVAEAEAIG